MAKQNSVTRKVKSELEKLEEKLIHKGGAKIRLTRKDKSLSKKQEKIQKDSRKINRNKVRHHKTAKEKKNS